MYSQRKNIQVLMLLFSIVIYSQSNKHDTLRGNFTYLLKAKLNTITPEQVNEELFSLQIGDSSSFFASIQSMKRDSVIQSISKKASENGTNFLSTKCMFIPKTKFPYTIIQTNENIEYFQWIGVTLITYKQNIINNWKLINESKKINTINCKKAEVNFKGRNWIAWYSTEIPFNYGPYKFSGLPGLIIKITDEKGEYDFELVKSTSSSGLKGKLITINKDRYTDAVETTQKKFEQALEDSNNNISAFLSSSGTTIIKGQEIIQQRQKERELNKKGKNPIELSE